MKRPRKRRIVIAPGIYREQNFFVATKRMGSTVTGEDSRRKKFDLETPLAKMLAWQARAQAELLDDLPSAPREGTIAGDVEKFLCMIPEGRTREDFADLLQHWINSPLGAEHRHELTREAIIGQRSRWVEAGAAAVTVNHRLRALRALYNGLDGPTVPHPTDKIPNVKGPARTPRGIPMDVVETILAELPDHGRAERFGTWPDVSLTKIRLSVIAWTGIPPVQLERLQARHLDLSQCVDRRGARVYLQPRRKAKGSPGAWVKLLPQAVEAFEQFSAANLWGKPFSRSSMGKSWKGAIRRITERLSTEYKRTKDRTALDAWLHAIPPHCRPYDLRHSFGTEAYRITGDLRAVAELLQHADLETTKQYTGGAVSERVSSAIDKMTDAHTAAKRPRLVKPHEK
jgi:integrase